MSILNNILSLIACIIYKFEMFSRLESIDETEYAIRYNLRKQILLNYNVLKIRQPEKHANYYYQIAEMIHTYYHISIDIHLLYDEHEKF